MSYCLTNQEVAGLLRELCFGRYGWLDDETQLRIRNASNWVDQACLMSYFACQLFERMVNDGVDCTPAIKRLYQLPEQMWLHIEEIGYEFVEFLLSHDRSSFASLAEALVEVQRRFEDFDYSSTVRNRHE